VSGCETNDRMEKSSGGREPSADERGADGDDFRVTLTWPGRTERDVPAAERFEPVTPAEPEVRARPKASAPSAEEPREQGPAPQAEPVAALSPTVMSNGLSQQTALLTTLSALMEGVHGMISSLSMRLDALSATTSAGQRSVTNAVDQLSARVDALVDGLEERTADAKRAPRADVDLSGITDAIDALSSVVDELRGDLAQLRRRIPVRARTTAVVDDAQIDEIARVVVERLLAVVDVDMPPETPAPVPASAPAPAPRQRPLTAPRRAPRAAHNRART